MGVLGFARVGEPSTTDGDEEEAEMGIWRETDKAEEIGTGRDAAAIGGSVEPECQ